MSSKRPAPDSNPQSDRRDEPKLKVQVWIYRQENPAELTVLLLRLIPQRGGFWQPVTGGVEEGESLAEAALREAQEETGLDFDAGPEALGYHFRFFSPRFGRECEEHVFGLRVSSRGKGQPGVRLDPREHVESKWLAAAEVPALLKHASNAEGFRRLLQRKGLSP